MRTVDYMDAVKSRLHLSSDYKLAQALNARQQNVSAWRVGKTTIGDDLAPRIAELLDMPTEKVLADLHAERERNPALVPVWRAIAAQFARVACMLAGLLALNITLAPESKASESLAAPHSSAKYKSPIFAAVRRICMLIALACKFAYFGTAHGTGPNPAPSV